MRIALVEPDHHPRRIRELCLINRDIEFENSHPGIAMRKLGLQLRRAKPSEIGNALVNNLSKIIEAHVLTAGTIKQLQGRFDPVRTAGAAIDALNLRKLEFCYVIAAQDFVRVSRKDQRGVGREIFERIEQGLWSHDSFHFNNS